MITSRSEAVVFWDLTKHLQYKISLIRWPHTQILLLLLLNKKNTSEHYSNQQLICESTSYLSINNYGVNKILVYTYYIYIPACLGEEILICNKNKTFHRPPNLDHSESRAGRPWRSWRGSRGSTPWSRCSRLPLKQWVHYLNEGKMR